HLCIDLNQSEETLMKEMSKSARYSVRRAIRDQIQIKYIDNPTLTDIENFTTFYNQFAEAKGIEPCKLEKLIGLMKAELLYLTYAQDENGVSLGGSALICNVEIAIVLYGASILFDDTEYSGQYISRANRFLHHSEVMHFKGKGCHTYDLMSLSTDKDDKEFQKINDYKRKLGGEERIIYSSLVPK